MQKVLGPLVLAMDGSIVGRGCMTLMVSVVYKQRALPVAWIVAKRRKGHFPETVHLELMRKVQGLIPDGARVVLLGDGEFDGVDLQALVRLPHLCHAPGPFGCILGGPFGNQDVVAHFAPLLSIDVSQRPDPV